MNSIVADVDCARRFVGVDLVCLIRDASVSTRNGDRFVLDLLQRSQKPALLLPNKRQTERQVSIAADD